MATLDPGPADYNYLGGSMKIAPFHLGKSSKGFSLVELMIVVAIIGILSALAVPRFQKFQAKAKQSEAKTNLSHIYTLEVTYQGDYDTYNTNLTSIGFQLPPAPAVVRYNYTITTASTSAFVGNATAKTNDNILASCGNTDAWTINDQKALTAIYDCTAH